MVAPQGGLRGGRAVVEHRQLRPLRPHPVRAREDRRPAPLHRGALSEPRGVRGRGGAHLRAAGFRAPDAPGGRRPFHRRRPQEQSPGPGDPAGSVDPGRGLRGTVEAHKEAAMAAIHIQKIHQSTTSVGPGKTAVFGWNNPPAGTVLSFFANPFFLGTDTASANFAGAGSLQIGKVTYTDRLDTNA